MNQSENINEIAASLSKVQGEIKDAKLDKINPHYKSKFASLSSVYASVRETLPKYNLSFSHSVEPWEGSVLISTILLHTSGQWLKSQMPVKLDLSKPQSIGSAITYGKRYLLAALVGISDCEDDDGNAAEEASKEAANKAKAPKEGDMLISKNDLTEMGNLIGDDAELKKMVGEIHKSFGYKSAASIQKKNLTRYIKAIENYKNSL